MLEYLVFLLVFRKLKIFYFLLLPFFLNGQILQPKQEQAILNTIASQFGMEEANNQILNLGPRNFQIIGRDTFFNPNGFLYVFKINGDTLKRLDKSIFHGFDNHRYLFSFDNKLFSLGGYGGFTTNNNVKFFNEKSQGWQYVKCSGDIPPFILGPLIRKGDFLYAFYNFRSGNNVEPDLLDSNSYCLNLRTMNWQKLLPIQISKKFFNVRNIKYIYTKNYFVMIGETKFIVLNPESNKYIELNNEDFGFGFLSPLNYVNQDTIILDKYYQSNGVVLKLDINKIWTTNFSKTQTIHWKKIEQDSDIFTNIFLLFSVLLFLISISALVFSYKLIQKSKILKEGNLGNVVLEYNLQKTESSADQNEIKRIIQEFSELTNNELTWEEMDKILNISHLEGDSRKLRRHRLLKDFPTGMIIRKKDEKDKRRFIYFIDRAILHRYISGKN